MSVMDRIKSLFSGGSSADGGERASGHDHSDHDHSHEPAAEPAAMATPEPGDDAGEDRPA